MPFAAGVFPGNIDVDGNVVTSRDLQIANQKFFIEGFIGTCGTGATEYSTPIKIQQSGVDIDSGICGLKFTAKNHQYGDYARLEVVDVDNILGYGAGLVVGNFGERFYIPHDGFFDILLDYKKVVIAGLYYRIRYVATEPGVSREYICNLYLVKTD